MNILYVIATALTVSVDSLLAGFSLSINKRKNMLLPMTVALVTYLLCVAASFVGILLREFLQTYVKYIGATILICLGIGNLAKKDEHTLGNVTFTQCLAIGFGVGFDGAVASLTLVLQNIGDVVFTPLLFSVTHFATIRIGQHLAQNAQINKANVFSSVMFFALAFIKLLDA